MSMAEYGYALALYAYGRSELAPVWAKHLRSDLRRYCNMNSECWPTPVAFPCRLPARMGRRRASPIETAADEQHGPGQSSSGDTADEHTCDAGDSAFEMAADNESLTQDLNADEPSIPSSAVDAYFAEAMECAHRAEYRRAVELYSLVLRHSPRDVEAWICSRRSMACSPRVARGLSDGNRAVELDGDSWEARRVRAHAALWRGEFQAAINDLYVVLKQENRNAAAIYLLGLARLGAGHFWRVAPCAVSCRMLRRTLLDDRFGSQPALRRVGRRESALGRI